MVASAGPAKGKIKPEPAAQLVAEAKPQTEAPRPVLAAFTPPVIAEDPREPGTPPAKLFTYASAGGVGLPSMRPKAPKVAAPAPNEAPAYQDASVVSAPEADDDHPEALSYMPFDVAGLMTDSSVTYSRTIAPLTHPEQDNLDHLFDDMDQPTAFTFRKGSGYVSLAAAQRFSGEAVRNLYAEVEPANPAPTQLAQSTR